MVPKRVDGQYIFFEESWSNMMRNVESGWNDGLVVTDMDYGDDGYCVVMSSGTDWGHQVVLHGSVLPREKISEGWNSDYVITNMLCDEQDWIVIMTQVSGIKKQRVVLDNDWSVFRSKIREAWDEDMVVTKLCCEIDYSYNAYCAVVTEYYNSPSQNCVYIDGAPTPQELCDMCGSNQILTDFHDVEGGVLTVTEGETGWGEMRIFEVAYAQELIKLLGAGGFDDGFRITTVSYYRGRWYGIFCRPE